MPTTTQVRTAIGAGLAAYLAFDAGLQRLGLPSSMSADVTAQLHADALVEADYENVPSDASLLQMATDLSTAHQDSSAAAAATITLRRDLGPAANFLRRSLSRPRLPTGAFWLPPRGTDDHQAARHDLANRGRTSARHQPQAHLHQRRLHLGELHIAP